MEAGGVQDHHWWRRLQGAEILAVGVVFREDNVLAGPLYSAPAN